MLKTRWFLALPLALAAWVGTAQASSIRDEAGLFDPETVRQAQDILDRVESRTKLPTTIETITSLEGAPIDEVTVRHAERDRASGVFILIAKKEHKIEVRAARGYRRALPDSRLAPIRTAFLNEFKKGDYSAGLKQGVAELEREVTGAQAANGGLLLQNAPNNARRAPVNRPGGGQQSFGLGSLLGIGLGIIAILFILRLIGSAFGGGHGYAGPGRMGGPGYGAPGYGGAGGGGGGFLSSMFGGIGGAIAGNWLYDQFSGRHHGGYTDNSSTYGDAGQGYSGDSGASDWSGGGGVSGDWGDSGGGGGGDWGGGGGGDWGGGDSGGGGGDW
ncbi:TPM domain-containing protein [Singulisphaera sp. PoT]|uniref:TPM domain-containing protein n=1 Tax=Singulisphaera sp. PoT TaxID=3411797 RepID=UPI003BF513FA